jgi:acetolactate synthase-1/2/3 large subunit
MLEMQELSTAMTLKLPIVFVVIHNSAYGNMKRDQVRHYDKRVIGTDLNLPDLCALASSFGAHAERVEKPGDLVPAIKTALKAERPALLDVICPIEGL